MSEQLVIALGREFGSGGQKIAKILAERFQLPLYENNILVQLAESRGMDAGKLEQYDEKPRNPFLYRTVKGYSNAPSDALAQLQFEYLRERAAAGESFVVLGRCAEEILKGTPGLVTIFIRADLDDRKNRIMRRDAISESEALFQISDKDRKRKAYHNRHCKGKWGDSANYDITLNSTRLGVDGTADILEQYVRARMGGTEPAES